MCVCVCLCGFLMFGFVCGDFVIGGCLCVVGFVMCGHKYIGFP